MSQFVCRLSSCANVSTSLCYCPLFDLAMACAHWRKLFVCCLFVLASCLTASKKRPSRAAFNCLLAVSACRPPLADIESDLSEVGEEAKLMSYLTRRPEVFSTYTVQPVVKAFNFGLFSSRAHLHFAGSLWGLPPLLSFVFRSFFLRPPFFAPSSTTTVILPASRTLICCPYCQLQCTLSTKESICTQTRPSALPCFMCSLLWVGEQYTDLMCIDLLSPAALVREGKTVSRVVEA